MAVVTIICPHCEFSKEIERTVIPSGVTKATCPKCKQGFDLNAAIKEKVEPIDDPFIFPTATPPPVPPPPAPPEEPQKPVFDDTPPPAAILAPPPKPRVTRVFQFSFTGNAREYFGIWIVNTLLKIVTLGIYTAWAKVRKRRYFYSNTLLNNACFEYLADPKVLFRGWLIGALSFIIYSIGVNSSPSLAGVFAIIFYLALPWLVVRSKMFNQKNSAHRNIHFSFQPNYREAYTVFLGLPILITFTLGLITPYIVYRQKKFMIENSGYGKSRCTFDASVKDFYIVFLKAFGWFILFIIVLAIAAFSLSATFREFYPLFVNIGETTSDATTRLAIISGFIGFFVFLLLYLFFAIYVQTNLTNLAWNSTMLRNNRFISTMRVRDMAWLYISSAFAIFASIGLLIPWASIRIARYRFEKLAIETRDDLESFSASETADIGAAGEEIGDAFGIDIGL